MTPSGRHAAAAVAGARPPAAAAPAVPPTPAEVTRRVRAALEQYRQGLEVHSVDALAALYAQAPDLVVTRQGTTLVGWPAVQEDLAGFLAANPRVKVRLERPVIVALGDGGALATAGLHRTYGDDTRTVDETGTLTLVLVRDGGAFRIVAEHFSWLSAP